MSPARSIMSEADEEFVREVMYIMIVWTLIVVLAGVVLVVAQDPFASVFAFSVLGL